MFLFFRYRAELQRPDFDDGQLLEILRGKDNQIVALEGKVNMTSHPLTIKLITNHPLTIKLIYLFLITPCTLNLKR